MTIAIPRVRVSLLASLLLAASGCWLLAPRMPASGTTAYASQPSTPVSPNPGAHALVNLPAAAQQAVSRGLGSDQSAYRVRRGFGALQTTNPRQRLSARFGARGVTVSTAAGSLTLGDFELGRGGSLQAFAGVAPQMRTNRVIYHYSGAEEWFANGPLGLEHGVTLLRRPAGPAAARLVVAIPLSGSLRAHAANGGLMFTTARGQRVLRYGQLSVSDARGQTIPATLGLAHGRIEIEIQDRAAHYPLTVDPALTQAAELTASDGGASDFMGYSVAVSGSTIVVGAPFHKVGAKSQQGAVYVFAEGASGWANATQTAELTASDGAAADLLGYSVAISGQTIVTGAPQHTVGSSTLAGAVYVFTEPAGGWANATQTAELLASSPNGDGLGTSVAISGQTIVAGANTHKVGSHPGQGAAFVFAEPTGGWADGTQTAILTASDGARGDDLGQSVAISGQAIVAGAPDHTLGANQLQGAVYVFTQPAGGWTDGTQTAELTASDGAGNDDLGWSVAIDTSTIVAGAVNHQVGANSSQGAAYVFTKPAGGWTDGTQTAELTASDGAVNDAFGVSVAVSGQTVVAGDLNHQVAGNVSQGAAYVFTQPAGGWANSTQTAEVTAADGAAYDQLGWSVAVDSSTVVVGSPRHQGSSAQGAAYTYVPQAAAQTTRTSLAESANPARVGQHVTYTAAVTPTPDGGTVAFTDNGSAISGCGSVAVNGQTGQASCPVTYGTAGSHSIQASYSGDANYSGSSSAAITEAVNPSAGPTVQQLKQAVATIGRAVSGVIKQLTAGHWAPSVGVSAPGAGTVCTIVLLGSKAGPVKCGSTQLLVPAKKKHHPVKPTVLASGAHAFARAGQSKIVLRFTRRAQKLLRTGRTEPAIIVVAYIVRGHAPIITTKQVKLHVRKAH